ncbi:hypothetical protein LSUE1_G006293 [Lachnellula suecica]|uniref:Uncharacterized protein n=1 Tax=Lachnellula suecica TaxID=602035 RepID=A0A8T9C0M3_9HELO|nr:hypothetical protein LSUE1_G006293 [Lachnellula suecica]
MVSPAAAAAISTRVRAVYPKHHQCTHHIVTRLYTKEHRCMICYETGQFGWLYRCAQDRELLLDDDWETGFQEKLDPLCDIFERPGSRPRSPQSRLSKLEFLNEITNEQLKTYTPSQLSLILEQRSHLHDVIIEDSEHEALAFRDTQISKSTGARLTLRQSTSTPETPLVDNEKPWLPHKGGECQFKMPTYLPREGLSES